MITTCKGTITILASLLFAAFAIGLPGAVAAEAATGAPARQVAAMGVTSTGRIFNLERPPSWLRPNTQIHPLNYQSPDSLYYQGDQICYTTRTALPCINNWGGGGQGNLLKFYQYGEGTANNQWNWWYEGTVSPTQSWPFTIGTGINNDYNGNPVFKFAFAPGGKGSGNCISQQLFTPGDNGSDVNLTSCAAGNAQTKPGSLYQYFVLDGNGRLVAVAATNSYVQTIANNTGRVWVGVGPNGSSANGEYVYLVSNEGFAEPGFGAYP